MSAAARPQRHRTSSVNYSRTQPSTSPATFRDPPSVEFTLLLQNLSTTKPSTTQQHLDPSNPKTPDLRALLYEKSHQAARLHDTVTRFPANEAVKGDSVAVAVTSIRNDVQGIIQDFEQTNSYSFRDFAACWKRKSAGDIHFVCLDVLRRPVFVQTIYQMIIDHYCGGSALVSKLAALYTLFAVYFSQPSTFVRTHIKLMYSTYQSFHYFYVYCTLNHVLAEAAIVFEKLQSDDAFQIVSQPWSEPGWLLSRSEGDAGKERGNTTQ